MDVIQRTTKGWQKELNSNRCFKASRGCVGGRGETGHLPTKVRQRKTLRLTLALLLSCVRSHDQNYYNRRDIFIRVIETASFIGSNDFFFSSVNQRSACVCKRIHCLFVGITFTLPRTLGTRFYSSTFNTYRRNDRWFCSEQQV